MKKTMTKKDSGKSKQTFTIVGISLVVALVLIGIVSATGFGRNLMWQTGQGTAASSTANIQEWEGMDQMHAEVEKAIEANDYAAFRAIHEKYGMAGMMQGITEANFPTFVAMHEAMQTGDYAKATQLHQELGLGANGPQGTGGCPMMQ